MVSIFNQITASCCHHLMWQWTCHCHWWASDCQLSFVEQSYLIYQYHHWSVGHWLFHIFLVIEGLSEKRNKCFKSIWNLPAPWSLQYKYLHAGCHWDLLELPSDLFDASIVSQAASTNNWQLFYQVKFHGPPPRESHYFQTNPVTFFLTQPCFSQRTASYGKTKYGHLSNLCQLHLT